MSRNLELIFENMEGKVVRMTLEAPVEPANPALITQVMDEIIAKNVFDSSGGDIVAKRSARIVERSVEEITIL